MEKTKTDGGFHIARKEHRCDHYFSHKCVGTGKIEKGDRYFSPYGDIKEGFTPYRVCCECERTLNV